VRGINNLYVFPRLCWNRAQRVTHSLHRGSIKIGMVEECPQFIHFRRPRANFALCPRNVPRDTAGILNMSCRLKSQTDGSSDPILFHLPQSVCQERMPVSVPQIDWQAGPVSFQLRLQCGNQIACLLVDRALASEVVIVLGYSERRSRGIFFPRNTVSRKESRLPGILAREGYNRIAS